MGFLAFVAFALLVTTAILVGLNGGGTALVVGISLWSFVFLLLVACLCYMPSMARARDTKDY